MGNLLACGPVRVNSVGGLKPSCSFARLVLTDGTVVCIKPPVMVAELMLDHPSHFVFHVNQDQDQSSSLDHHHHDRPLPADTELECGEIYYLQSKNASFNSKSPLRQLKRSFSDCDRKSAASLFLPSFLMKQRGAVTQVTVSTECLAQAEDRSSKKHELEEVCDNPELQMAYEMRVVARSVSWRPKLATIEETVHC